MTSLMNLPFRLAAFGTGLGQAVQNIHYPFCNRFNSNHGRHLIHVHSRFKIRHIVTKPYLECFNCLVSQLAVFINGRTFTIDLLNMFKHEVAGHFHTKGLLQSIINVKKIKRFGPQIINQ